MNAPEFPSGLEWLNTDRPLRLAGLRGKVVLLDFWTYCCINCMHIIPDLKRLEKEHPDELVVIGVHSAKFTQEGPTENIRQAMLRYEIAHPVINDRNFLVWQSYAANSWPTVVLIDPEGRIVMTAAGEGVYDRFTEPIRRLIEAYDKKGLLDRTPLNRKTEAMTVAEEYLAFPGKVLAAYIPPLLLKGGQAKSPSLRSRGGQRLMADLPPYASRGGQRGGLLDWSPATASPTPPTSPSIEGGEAASPTACGGEEGGVLFISDQNHNRVVVCKLSDGSVLDIIGSGRNGFEDGSFAAAEFNHPQGMALVGTTLYIADTENHAVRAADFETKQVTTLAGSGHQALGWGASGGKGRNVALSSPWDLAARDGILYVAMAGTHQIWTISLNDGFAQPFAGSSQEGLRDGVRQRAALAQPSGLALLGDRLYFADSEVSAIRYVELGAPDGRVRTVVGLDLFEFGDKDGVGDDVRLQHPLGVTTEGKLLYVADTYNSKIKVIDPAARSSRTLFGGNAGLKDGKGTAGQLYEPGGLCYANGRLYIADTNNQRIRVADLATSELFTLAINVNDGDNANANDDVDGEIRVKQAMVGAGEGRISLELHLPAGMKLQRPSPVVLTLVDGGAVAMAKDGVSVAFTPDEQRRSYDLPVVWKAGSGEVMIETDYVYCGERDATVCYPGHKRLRLPVKVGGEGGKEVKVEVR